MPLMNSDVYDALIAVGVPQDKARKAAESVTNQHIERDLLLLKWMVGFNLAITFGGFGAILRILLER